MARTAVDYTGKTFGRLTVTREVERQNGKRYVECACECGSKKIYQLNHLQTGRTISCGCFRVDCKKKPSLGKFVIMTLGTTAAFDSSTDAEKFIMQNPNRPYLRIVGDQMRFEYYHSDGQWTQVLENDWFVMPEGFEVDEYTEWATCLLEHAKTLVPSAVLCKEMVVESDPVKWRLTQQISRWDAVNLLGDFLSLREALKAGTKAVEKYSTNTLLIKSMDRLNHRIIYKNGTWVNARTESEIDVQNWLKSEEKRV